MILSKFKLSIGEQAIILISFLAISLNLFLPESLSNFRAHWNAISWSVISFLTALRCHYTARSFEGTQRKAWNMIALGCFFWFLGMLFWDYYSFTGNAQPPFPSLADLGYLLLAPCIIFALIYFANKTLTLTTVLYQFSRIGIIFSSLLVIYFLIFSSVIESKSVSNLYFITSLSYPLLFFTALIHAFISPWHIYNAQQHNIIQLIFLGLLLHAISNAEYAYIMLDLGYYSSYYLDIAWTIGFTPIYFAASYAVKTKSLSKPYMQKALVWSSRYLDKFFLPTLLLGLAVTILNYRELIAGEMIEGFAFLFVAFTVMLAAYLWVAEEILKKNEKKLSSMNLELESRVYERTKELEKASNAKSEFLSRMSHELRTPMNAIYGFSQVLELDEKLNYEQKKSVFEIIESSEHLMALITDILDLAKIEEGKIEINTEDVDLSNIISESLSLMTPDAKQRNINLINNIPVNTDYTVTADRLRLKQVLLNIISNAIKYNKEHGTVNIDIRLIEHHKLHILIKDTGPGIAKDKLEKLFVPFERLGHELNAIEGVGIGLSLSKKLMKLMDGNIYAQDTSAEGCTFAIELPYSNKRKTLKGR